MKEIDELRFDCALKQKKRTAYNTGFNYHLASYFNSSIL